jgi:hypothetical protein
MRNVLAAMLMFVMTSISAFSQNIINSTQYNISAFAFKCCNDLAIDSCLIMISQSNDLLKFGLKGHSGEIDKGHSYLISVGRFMSFQETEKAIAHELVHLKQMKSGLLTFDKDSIKYNGKKYPNIRENHSSNVHEIEAINTGAELYKKYHSVLFIL